MGPVLRVCLILNGVSQGVLLQSTPSVAPVRQWTPSSRFIPPICLPSKEPIDPSPPSAHMLVIDMTGRK